MIKALTWIAVVLLLVGYVAFFAGRYRKEQAAKRAVAPATPPPPRPRPGATMPASPPLEPLPPPAAPRTPVSEVGSPQAPPFDRPAGFAPGPAGTGASGGEVADLIRGIQLPEELVPRPDVLPRPGVHDRVVFVTTDAPADIVRGRLATALEVIGVDVRWDDDGWLALLSRDGRDGWLQVHPSPTGVVPPGTVEAPTVPSHTVCVEFWTDAV